MIYIEYATPLHASRSAAWSLLRSKVEMPQRFLPRVVACEVTERGASQLLRRVTFDDGTAVTERVRFLPEQEVAFEFVDHPKFEGEIRHVLFELGDELWLSFCFQGEAKRGVELGRAELDQLREGFARAVQAAARQIEGGERAALETT